MARSIKRTKDNPTDFYLMKIKLKQKDNDWVDEHNSIILFPYNIKKLLYSLINSNLPMLTFCLRHYISDQKVISISHSWTLNYSAVLTN